MKSLLRLVPFLFVIFFFYGNTLGASAPKIGTVDIQKFQSQSKAFQRTSARLKQKYEAMKGKLEEERETLAKLEEEFKKQSMMLSLDAHEDKKRELERKKRYVKYLIDDFSQEMKQMDLENTKKILKELEQIVERIGKEGGYTIILEKTALGLIYVNAATDVTDQVIEIYDSVKR